MPANFKTFEAQSRLLAAVIAAHPGLKLDYKAISQHYGSDTTMSAMEHRFRPVKKQAEVLRMLVSNNMDTKDVDISNKDEIAKYFGESTPDGIQFQFRGIKSNADALKAAANNGESPAPLRTTKTGSIPATPRKRGNKSAAATPGTRGSSGTAGGRTTSAAKRKVSRPNYKEVSKDDSSTSVDYDELDQSPSRNLPKKIKTTPNITGIASRHAPAPAESMMMSGALVAPIPAPIFTAAAPPPAAAPVSGGALPSPSFALTPDSDFSVQTPTRQQHQMQPAMPHKQDMASFTYPLPDYGDDPDMSFLSSASGMGDLNRLPAGFGNDYAFVGDDEEDNGEI